MFENVAAMDRFMDKIIMEPNTGCWLFSGHLDIGGYGVFWFNGKNRKAHRFAYEAEVGAIPDGLFLDHTCRTRSCCNPRHLRPCTMFEKAPAATNRAKTHCLHGHEFNSDNAYVHEGARRCRVCNLRNVHRYNARKRAALESNG